MKLHLFLNKGNKGKIFKSAKFAILEIVLGDGVHDFNQIFNANSKFFVLIKSSFI